MDPVAVAKIWLLVRPFKRWKEHRARKRRLRELGIEEETTMLNGKLTYTGVAALALAWLMERFGIPAAPEELEAVIAAVVAAGGLLAGLYGRYRATKAVPGKL